MLNGYSQWLNIRGEKNIIILWNYTLNKKLNVFIRLIQTAD